MGLGSAACVLVPLPVPPCRNQGDRRAAGGAQRCVDAGPRASASSLRGLTGPRALRETGGSSTTIFKEKEERGKRFFLRSSPPALASFPISAPCAELLALCPCCAEEAEWAWGCGWCGNCSYQAAFRQERIIIIIKSLMVPRELRRRSCPRGLIHGLWCFLSLGCEFLGSLCCGKFCCVPEISRRSRESRPGAGAGRASCRTRLVEKQGRSIRKASFLPFAGVFMTGKFGVGKVASRQQKAAVATKARDTGLQPTASSPLPANSPELGTAGKRSGQERPVSEGFNMRLTLASPFLPCAQHSARTVEVAGGASLPPGAGILNPSGARGTPQTNRKALQRGTRHAVRVLSSPGGEQGF